VALFVVVFVEAKLQTYSLIKNYPARISIGLPDILNHVLFVINGLSLAINITGR